jgi:hypothetical protein
MRAMTRPLRLVLQAFAALALAAGILLLPLAERTEDWFSWTIAPPLTAAFLGGAYWAAFALLAWSARAPDWRRASVAIPPVASIAVVGRSDVHAASSCSAGRRPHVAMGAGRSARRRAVEALPYRSKVAPPMGLRKRVKRLRCEPLVVAGPVRRVDASTGKSGGRRFRFRWVHHPLGGQEKSWCRKIQPRVDGGGLSGRHSTLATRWT